MTIWICSECSLNCKLERDSHFKPERCIYKERGTDKMAHWRMVQP